MDLPTAKICSAKITALKVDNILDSKKGRKAFDVNIRVTVTFHEIVKGLSTIETFCSVMNIPPPMTLPSYYEIVEKLYSASVKPSSDSMLTAFQQCIDNNTANINGSAATDNDGSKNVTVSVDGTWQCHGYSSLNGVITVISNDKCIDTHKHCPKIVKVVDGGREETDHLSMINGLSHIIAK